jgi:hypothetical protein
VLFDRRALAALALAALVVTPHLLWLAGHPEVGTAVAQKLAAEEGEVAGAVTAPGPGAITHALAGLADLARAVGLVAWTTLAFLTPFWLLFAALFPMALRGPRAPAVLPVATPGPTPAPYAVCGRRLLWRWLALALTALVVTAWASGTTELKERWLQPLLFIVPALLFARVLATTGVGGTGVDAGPGPERVARRLRWFSGLALGAGLLVLVVSAVRLPLAPLTGGYSRLNQPIPALALALARHAPPGALVIAADYHLAGALRLHLPDRLLFGPREDFLLPPLAELAAGRPVVLVWDAGRSPTLPEGLAALATAAGRPLDAAATPATPARIVAPSRWFTDRPMQLGVHVLPPP